MNDNLEEVDKSSYRFYPKGINLEFDPNSDISSIPLQIELEIENGFYSIYEGTEPYDIEKDEDYKILVSHTFYEACFPAINFILGDKGIKIPSKYLFKKQKDFFYEFIFLLSKKNDKIILGKDLIELMKVEFFNNGEFSINNIDFRVTTKD